MAGISFLLGKEENPAYFAILSNEMLLMRTILVFFAFLLSSQLCAQPTKSGQKRINIGETGCSYLNYCDTPFSEDLTTDSSNLYSVECVDGGATYGLICVLLKTPFDDLAMAEDMLIAYLDYLKENFTITRTVGYSRGYRLNHADSTRGINDRWEDSEGDKWNIRGWTNGKVISVMYVYSQKSVPETKAEAYFNGFSFGK